MTCRVEKGSKGEVFEGLDNTKELVKERTSDDEFDKEVVEEGMKEQREISEKYDNAQISEDYTYGFGNRYRDTFRG